jgi:ribose-phosphate pyrophosphokinase
MRVVADVLAVGGFRRVIAVDLHASAVEGFLAVPLEHVSAVPDLAEAMRPHAGRDCVVVSPDLGAVKMAREYARLLALPLAIVHKTRLGPAEVEVESIIGDVRGRRPILVDDMITTGGTLAAAAKALVGQGASPDIIAAATHAVFVAPAAERLAAIGLRRLFVSDSLPPPKGLPFECDVIGLAHVLASAVRRACCA